MAYYTLFDDMVWDGQEQAHFVQTILKTEKPLKKENRSGPDRRVQCDAMAYPWHLVPSMMSTKVINPAYIIREISAEEVRQLLKKAEEELRIGYEANLETVRNFFK